MDGRPREPEGHSASARSSQASIQASSSRWPASMRESRSSIIPWLKVITSGFREGYLRKNGVPYSNAATITEYIHRLPETSNGDVWLHVLTIVADPRYLNDSFYTSTHFKREANGAKWNPTECRTPPPPVR